MQAIKKSKLVGMCGVSFSGKTTLAKRIAARMNAKYVSLDEINEERSLFGGDGIPPEEWEKTSAMAMGRIQKLLNDGNHVVLDDTLCFRWLRDRYSNFANECSAQFILVHTAIPMMEIENALVANSETKQRRSISLDVFRQHVISFEYPALDETAIIFDRSDSLDQWLNTHFPD